MLNIQFMTESQKTKNKFGKEVYIPDYTKLRENACCKEEIDAINHCEEIMDKFNDGFAFQIVYTTYTKVMRQNLKSGEITWNRNGQFISILGLVIIMKQNGLKIQKKI